MKKVKDVTRDIFLAGIGSLDEQNEEIKELLRRGSVVLGMSEVDNEELMYNGNRDEIMARRKAKEKEDNTYDLGHGRSIYVDKVKDDNGKVLERTIEYNKAPKAKEELKAVSLVFDYGRLAWLMLRKTDNITNSDILRFIEKDEENGLKSSIKYSKKPVEEQGATDTEKRGVEE